MTSFFLVFDKVGLNLFKAISHYYPVTSIRILGRLNYPGSFFLICNSQKLLKGGIVNRTHMIGLWQKLKRLFSPRLIEVEHIFVAQRKLAKFF